MKKIILIFLAPLFLFSQETVIYENNFETTPSSEWNTTNQLNWFNETNVLGNFGDMELVTLNLNELPPHTEIRIEFDLYIINAWDGNYTSPDGPDMWFLNADGESVIETTFANNTNVDNICGCGQSYPANGTSTNNPIQTGATQIYSAPEYDLPSCCSCGTYGTSVYSINKTINHTSNTVNFSFMSDGVNALTCDESWAIDNIKVFTNCSEGAEIDGFFSPQYYNGSYYYVSTGITSMESAMSTTNSFGGELAEPNSETLGFLCTINDVCCTSSTYFLNNMQGVNNAGGACETINYPSDFSGNHQFIMALNSCSTQGCTDTAACNYNSGATEDDGSCFYPETITITGEEEGCEESVTLTVNDIYNSYEWFLDGALIAGESGNTITASNSGQYSVTTNNDNNYSMDFDYFNSEYIEINKPFSGPNNTHTIMCWVKPENLGEDNVDHNIYLHGTYGDENDNKITIKNNSIVTTLTVGANEYTMSYPITDYNDWIHVAYVAHGVNDLGELSDLGAGGADNSKLKLYINGVLEQSVDLENDIDWDADFAYERIGGSGAYHGKIDELQIWDKPLTGTEIADNMCSPNQSDTDLLSYWSFEEGLGTTAYDQVGNNDGAIIGATHNLDAACTNLNCPGLGEIEVLFNICGCTDITACNYNPNATADDGSCEEIPQVTILGETETCEESVLLEAIGGPYDSYQWYFDGNIINNENQNTLLVTQTGTYKIETENIGSENNYSLLFDGQNGYVEINDSDALSMGLNDFTISTSIKINNIPTTPSPHVAIIQQFENNDNRWQIYVLDNQLYFGIKDGGSWNEVSVPWVPQINNWHHISCVRESGEISFYVDGENIGSVVAEINIPNLSAPLTLGKYEWDTDWTGLDGHLDNVSFWSQALSLEQINSFINCPPTGIETGLINLWSLEEVGQAVIFDFVNNLPVGQLVNMQTSGAWSNDVSENNCHSCLSSEELVITVNICGCTDSSADNFNAIANEDDGSCEYLGCTDSSADNFDSTANVNDGTCEYLGCTDSSANNFDSTANVDDGTCEYLGCTDSSANNFDSIANVDDGSCEYLGCTDPSACNYNLIATIDDGSCDYLDVNLGEDVTTCESFVTINAGEGFDNYEWSTGETTQTIDVTETGSYSVSVNNFGENNNLEIGSIYEGGVIFYIENNTAYIVTENILASGVSCDGNGVSTPWGCNGQLVGALGEGLGDGYQNTLNIISSGCADSTSPAVICYNYNNGFDDWYLPSIGELDLIYQNLFLTNSMYYDTCDPNNWYRSSTECNENSVKDFNFGGGNAGMGMDNCNSKSDWQGGVLAIRSADLINPITCSDSDDVFVTINNCGCTDSTADNFDSTANSDDGSCEYLGCIDTTADNFDSTANLDDGSCEYLGCIDDAACNYDSAANVDNGTCEYNTCAGCTETNADNFNPVATIDDGSCEYLGCTDSAADNFDSVANVNDGSCEYLGCTDSAADNFDSTANVDDGSCEYLGCTESSACNFDSTANTDDGSCQLCASREFNDGSYLDVDSEIINAQGITISFWVNDNDFCANPEDFATYIDFGSQDSYRYVIRNRSCKIEAFFEGDMLPTEFDWGTMDWGYPKASAAGGIGPQSGWRQITAVFCPTTIRVYVSNEDGTNLVASNGTGVYFSQGFNLFAEDVKRIGSNQVDYEPANAMIDEVRIWNRALSGEEISARAGLTTTLNINEELNLNGYWQMDCENPFLNEVTGQIGVDNLSVVNENFNNNSCETDNNYDYTCPVDLAGFADCNSCDPPEGCTDEGACNYDYLAVIPIEACFYVEDYCPDLEYPEYYDCDCKCINDSDSDDVCDELEVDGCSEDEAACNYNPEGTEPCEYPIDLFGVDYLDCSGDCLNDIDGDGECDEDDNCPDVYNPNQEDLNEDGIGDACDGIGLEEGATTKELIKVTDVLGREIQKETKGSTLMYWYNTGEVEIIYNFK